MKKFGFYMVAVALLIITSCKSDNGIAEIEIAVTDIRLLNFLMVEEGSEIVIMYDIFPYDATNKEIVWSSSNSAIATINTTGEHDVVLLKAWDIGECVITAATKDGNQKAICNVEVIAACRGIVVSKIDEITEIRLGEIAYYPQYDLSLSIENINDSRCPTGAMCVWEGNASVQFHLTSKNGEYNFALDTHQGQAFKKDTIIEGMRYQLMDVLPYPVFGEQHVKTVKIIVTKATNFEEDTSSIFSKWKLAFVSYMDTNISPATIDYSQYEIIYDFQGNNILIVSGETDNINDYRGHEKGIHYYEKLPPYTSNAMGINLPQIKIDAKTHGITFGWVFFDSYEGEAMHINTENGTLILVKAD